MMPRALLTLATVLLLGGPPAPPALAAGVNLNWNDCIAGGVCWNKDFACDVNTGASTMVGSYVPPAHIDSVCGIDVVVDLQSTTPVLPLWWNLQTGGCRAGALSRSFDFTTGPFTCVDHWSGNVALAAGGYTVTGPNTARIWMSGAVERVNCDGPSDTGVDPGIEHYAFKLTINHTKTVEAGSCDGCLVPVCLVLNEIKLYSPPRGAYDVITYLTFPDVQGFVGWHGAGPSTAGCFGGGGGAGTCLDETPVLNRTWGAVKSIYR